MRHNTVEIEVKIRYVAVLERCTCQSRLQGSVGRYVLPKSAMTTSNKSPRLVSRSSGSASHRLKQDVRRCMRLCGAVQIKCPLAGLRNARTSDTAEKLCILAMTNKGA